MSLDAALAHDHAILRNRGNQIERVFEASREGAKVAVIDADDPGPRGKYTREFFRVVQFHQSVQAHRDGFPLKFGESISRKDLRDQQGCVRAGDAGLEKLITIQYEILAKHRAGHSFVNRLEIRELPLEILFVRQHADGRGSVGMVGSSNRDGVKVRPDDPGGGRGLFHLRDDANLTRPMECPGEVPCRGEAGEASFEVGLGDASAGRCDLLPFGRHDRVENRCHPFHSVVEGRRLPIEYPSGYSLNS